MPKLVGEAVLAEERRLRARSRERRVRDHGARRIVDGGDSWIGAVASVDDEQKAPAEEMRQGEVEAVAQEVITQVAVVEVARVPEGGRRNRQGPTEKLVSRTRRDEPFELSLRNEAIVLLGIDARCRSSSPTRPWRAAPAAA